MAILSRVLLLLVAVLGLPAADESFSVRDYAVRAVAQVLGGEWPQAVLIEVVPPQNAYGHTLLAPVCVGDRQTMSFRHVVQRRWQGASSVSDVWVHRPLREGGIRLVEGRWGDGPTDERLTIGLPIGDRTRLLLVGELSTMPAGERQGEPRFGLQARGDEIVLRHRQPVLSTALLWRDDVVHALLQSGATAARQQPEQFQAWRQHMQLVYGDESSYELSTICTPPSQLPRHRKDPWNDPDPLVLARAVAPLMGAPDYDDLVHDLDLLHASASQPAASLPLRTGMGRDILLEMRTPGALQARRNQERRAALEAEAARQAAPRRPVPLGRLE